MAGNNNSIKKPIKSNLIMRLIKTLVLYPFRVRKRYLVANAAAMEAAQECKSDQEDLDFYRKNNIKLLNIWIHSGFAMILVFILGFAYWQAANLTSLVNEIRRTPHIQVKTIRNLPGELKRYKNNILAAGKEAKVIYLFYGIGVCYFFSFFGAMILSTNKAWKEHKLIQDALISNNYKDFEGNPWKVFWLQDIIIFHTYQCDPDAFRKNEKFWNTIRFSPDIPVQFQSDTNKLIVRRAYTLPATLEFRTSKEE